MQRYAAIAVLLAGCASTPRAQPRTRAAATPAATETAPPAPPPASPAPAPPPRCADPVSPPDHAPAGQSGPATDVPFAGGIYLDLPRPYRTEGIALDRCSVVEGIQPPEGDALTYTIVLAGPEEPDARTFYLRVPGPSFVPFDVGDVVHVRIEILRIQIHAVRSGLVTDPDGRLLLAFSGTGDPSWAPGWSVSPGPVTNRSGNVESHVLDLTYLGTRARTSDTAFVRMSTADGSWLVVGSAHTLARSGRGRGPVVPPHDFAPYTSFAVLRERGSP